MVLALNSDTPFPILVFILRAAGALASVLLALVALKYRPYWWKSAVFLAAVQVTITFIRADSGVVPWWRTFLLIALIYLPTSLAWGFRCASSRREVKL